MHILISNDDGIFANGIRALVKAAVAAGHRVTVCAPDTQRSAASHSATFNRALKAVPVDYEPGVQAYAIDGTPADCVRLGLHLTRRDPVDCVLSGVNNGANRGAAILYSGTVGAAAEASLCGVPGIAVSLCSLRDEKYEIAARLGVLVAEWAAQHPLPRGEIYNLNVPKTDDVKGVKAASVSHEFMTDAVYVLQPDGSYMIDDKIAGVPETDADCDLLINRAGYASLSVLTWNRQADTPVPDLNQLNGEFLK